jgi:predicted transcriptional regulator
MMATVRLDEEHEKKLKEAAAFLHKKKSEILREALDFYVDHIFSEKRRRILSAVEKVKTADRSENERWNGAAGDGLER